MSVIDRAFSIHDDALILRSQRSSILAANIANADTPDYKAKDMDFQQMLQSFNQTVSVSLAQTDAAHLPAAQTSSDPAIKYRIPLSPALDGNTVDMAAEQARFSENSVQYQSSMTLLSGKIRGLLLAIKGQ